MRGIVWSLEWSVARHRSRLAALNVAIPLLLVAPIALGGAPPAHAAATYTVLFTLFGTFGAAIPLVRDAETGILQRVALTGLSPRRLVLERLLAQTALDALQLLPALLVVLLAGDADPPLAATLPLLLAATLLSANALGTWVAALAGSIAEAALFGAVASLFALHGAGVFRTPDAGLAAAIERLAPFRPLHEALLHAAGAPAPHPAPTLLAAALLGAVFCGLISAILAPSLLCRLARIQGR